MLLELLVVTAALTGCVAGVVALWLYLVDRKAIRASLERVGELAPRADRAMAVIEHVGEYIQDPEWVGSCIASALTHGARHPDGSPVSTGDLLQGLVQANLPAFREWLEGMIPSLIALAFQKDLAQELQGKSALARSVSKLGGGLKGAQALQHGVKAATGGGALGMLGQVAEAAPALIELFGQLRQLKGGGGGGSSDGTSDWRPPV